MDNFLASDEAWNRILYLRTSSYMYDALSNLSTEAFGTGGEQIYYHIHLH